MLKKNFCDGWDNLFFLITGNLIFLSIAVGFYFAIGVAASVSILFIAVFILAIILLSIVSFSINESCAVISNFKSPSFKSLITELPNVWKDGLFFGLIFSFLIILVAVGMPFYFQMDSLLGIFLTSIIFWGAAITLLSLQWFLPVRAQLKNDFFKCLKKSYILFFDNAGFSIFLMIYTIFLIIISIPTFFLFPSITGILIAQNNAFRLRLYKYDWLEEHPELKTKKERRDIPWGELIADDLETLGPRPLKNFIFPWK